MPVQPFRTRFRCKSPVGRQHSCIAITIRHASTRTAMAVVWAIKEPFRSANLGTRIMTQHAARLRLRVGHSLLTSETLRARSTTHSLGPTTAARQPQKIWAQQINFLGEHDGPPERELKKQLITFFGRAQWVRTAYLARIRYEDAESIHVALCVEG